MNVLATRSLKCTVFLVSILTLLSAPTFAGNISNIGPSPSEDSSSSVLTPEEKRLNQYDMYYSGEIKNGDAEKIAKYIQTHAARPMLYLDSPGGDIDESLRIVSLIKALHMTTIVTGGGSCASACFFLWLAGDEHLAAGTIQGRMFKNSEGFIGLHRPYFKLDQTKKNDSNDIEIRQHELMQKISEYLRNQDIPQRLIDLMMSRPSNDIYWLTSDDINQLGNYTPGYEEILISRCGYDRNKMNILIENYALAKESGDSDFTNREKEKLNEYVRTLGNCEKTATPDWVDESQKNHDRLLDGWRPWLASNISNKR